jgi:hypothetical protein
MRINEIAPGEKLGMTFPSSIGKVKFDALLSKMHLSNNVMTKFLEDCSGSIMVMQNAQQFLYRGTNNAPDVFMGRTRNDRKSRETDQSIQDKIDEIMIAAGYTALRSNSIFCSSDASFAGQFGEAYLIFPVNGFSYTWSIEIDDFVMMDNIADELKNPNFLNNYRFRNNSSLKSALKSGNEILVHGSYYAFESQKYKNLLSKLLGIGKPDAY